MESALSAEHDLKTCQAIKEKDTQDKPQLTALYYLWKKLYVDYDKRTQLLNEKAKVSLMTVENFRLKLNKVLKTPEQIQETDLGNLEEFFEAEERQQIRSSSVQPKKIKGYWPKILKSATLIDNMLQPVDHVILESLTDVILPETEKTSTIKIRFEFESNDFFENTFLEISVDYDEYDNACQVNATEIKWKEGKDPTTKIVKVKEKLKGKKKKGKEEKTKEVEKKKQLKTFFRIFRHQEESTSDDSESIGSESDGSSQDLKDMYGFYSTVSVAELIWEQISKYHTAAFYGVDLKEIFDEYCPEEDGSGWDDDEQKDSEHSNSSSSDDDSPKPKKKKTEEKKLSKNEKDGSKGQEPPESEECKKH